MINTSIRLPLVWIEVAERARSSVQGQRGLLIGPALSGADGLPYLVTSVGGARGRWGRGSILASMVARALEEHPSGEWWAIGQADPQSGTQATYSATIGGPATAAGAVVAWINDRRYSVAVEASETASSIAQSLVAAIAEDLDAPVTAASDAGTVTVTCRHKGTIGNGIRVVWDSDHTPPAGVTLGTWSQTNGTGDHTFPTLPPAQYSKIAIADDALKGSLGDVLDSRWRVESMLYGWGVSAIRGNAETAIAAAQAAEYQWRHISRVFTETDTPTAPWDTAAAVCAACFRSDESDHGLTVSGLSVNVRAPQRASLTATQADLLLRYGVSPLMGSQGGRMVIARMVTTRWSDGSGGRDERSYQAPQMWALEYFLRGLLADLRATFARRRLADDAPYVPPGAVTPANVRDYLVGRIRAYVAQGVLEWDPDLVRSITVTRSDDDPSRLDVYLPVDLIDGLEILAVSVAY